LGGVVHACDAVVGTTPANFTRPCLIGSITSFGLKSSQISKICTYLLGHKFGNEQERNYFKLNEFKVK